MADTPFRGRWWEAPRGERAAPARLLGSVDLHPFGGTAPTGATTGDPERPGAALRGGQLTAGDGVDRKRRPAPLSASAATRPSAPATVMTMPGETTSAKAPATVMPMPWPATSPADTSPKAWPRRW